MFWSFVLIKFRDKSTFFKLKSSQNLAICNAGLSTGLDQTSLVSEFTKYGTLSNICLLPGKSYCFVVCADETSAVNIFNGTHGKSLLGQNETVIYLSYCDKGNLTGIEIFSSFRVEYTNVKPISL